MKNKLNILSLIIAATLLTACGTFKKSGAAKPDINTTTTTTTDDTKDQFASIVSTLGEWQTLQTSGNISLKGGNNFSSSVQVRMIRDEAIFISLRPVLGIEVGKLLITADSLYAVFRNAEIERIIQSIKASPEWLESVTHQAEEKGISLEQSLWDNAEYSYRMDIEPQGFVR